MRLDFESLDPQQRDLMISGRKALIERALEPDRGALDEYGSHRACLPADASETVAGLGCELAARPVMGGAEKAHAEPGGRLQLPPRGRAAVHAHGHQGGSSEAEVKELAAMPVG
jgi:hypothetical protein